MPYRDHEGIRRTKSFESKTDANAFLAQVSTINLVNKAGKGLPGGAQQAIAMLAGKTDILIDQDLIDGLERAAIRRLGSLNSWMAASARPGGRDGGGGLKESSTRSCRNYLGYAQEKIGTRDIGNLTKQDVGDLRNWMLSERGLSEASSAGAIRALKALFQSTRGSWPAQIPRERFRGRRAKSQA